MSAMFFEYNSLFLRIRLGACAALFVLLSLLPALPADAGIALGSSIKEVYQVYGSPKSFIRGAKRKVLVYDDKEVELVDDKVVAVRAKIPYAPSHMKPASAKDDKNMRNGVEIVKDFSPDGGTFEMGEVLQKESVTIVAFYADWCPSCRKMLPRLENLARSDEDVYLRKVNVDRLRPAAAKKFKVSALPDVRVFNKKGSQVGGATPSFNKVKEFLAQAKL